MNGDNGNLEITPHNKDDMLRHYDDLLSLQDGGPPLVNCVELSCRATKTFGAVEPTLEEIGKIIDKTKTLINKCK